MKNKALTTIIKILTICLIITFSLSYCFANQADSLVSLINKSKDSAKIDLLNKLCWEYIYNNPQKALSIAKKSKQLAQQINYLKGLADANSRIGIVFDVTGKYDSAIFYYNKSLAIAQKINNKKGIGSVYSNLGLTYWNKGELANALSFYLKAIPEFNTIKDSTNLGNNLNNIGLVYFDLRKYKKAKQYFFKSNTYNIATKNKRAEAACYSNIGACFEDAGIVDSALHYFAKSLEIKRKINDSYGIAITLTDIGLLYKRLKNYNKAIEYFNEGLDYKKLVNDKHGEASTLVLLADTYVDKQDKTTALAHYLKAEKIGESLNNYKLIAPIYLRISQNYDGINNELSFQYLKKYIVANDSLTKQVNHQNLNELSTKYETETKENEIKLLQQKNTINELAIDKNKQQRNVIALSAILVIAVLFLIYFQIRSRQRIKQEQEKLKVEQIKLSSIIIAQEKERKRISEELHDGVGQLLSAAKLNISSLDNNENTKIKHALELVDSSCEEIRTISHHLMPHSLKKVGVVESIKEFSKKINSSEKIKIHVEGELNESELKDKQIHIYRILQELLNNSIKHAKASEITIQFNDEPKEIAISIEDNGIGFYKEKIEKSTGNGWTNIKSRLAIINGSLELDSKINKGTAIHIYIAKG